MAKIIVIVGHPKADSYCAALGRAYLRGAQEGGHEARLFLIGEMSFDPALREGYRREQELEPDLLDAREAFLAADHVVLIFPLWCGDMPAILKGFIERILQREVLAMRESTRTTDWKLFKGKSARIIMTMGMPGFFYRWYYGAHALKLMKRSILQFIGIHPVRATLHGMVEAVSDGTRQEWLREAEALGYAAR